MSASQQDEIAKFWWGAWALGADATAVMALRWMRIAGGGAIGDREARRMIEEKLAANAALPFKLTASMMVSPMAFAAMVMDHYAPQVRANRRRLSR